MEKIIFNLTNFKRLAEYEIQSKEKKWGKSIKECIYTHVMDDIKSFKYDANNGMKWSAEEKASFEKLSHVDKKKYLINKMGFKEWSKSKYRELIEYIKYIFYTSLSL